MTPTMFWRTTPALLSSISNVHADLHNPDRPKIANTIEEAGIDI